MDKLELIKEAEKLIPNETLYSSIKVQGKDKAFELFLETDFINFIKEDADMTAEKLANYIISKFASMVKPNQAVKQIHSFIESIPNYSNLVKVSPDTYVDFRAFLIQNINSINENNEVIVITEIPTTKEKRTIVLPFERLYKEHLESAYREQTLEEKRETIDYYVNAYVKPEVLDAPYKGKTFKEYLYDDVLNQMSNKDTIYYIDESKIGYDLRIDDFIIQEVGKIEKELESSIIDKNNRIDENPLEVREIDASIDLGGEIPNFESLEEKDFVYSSLNLLRESIKNATSVELITKLVSEFKALCESLTDEDLYKFNSLIESISSVVDLKAKKLLIKENNKEEYIGALLDELSLIEEKLDGDFDYYRSVVIDQELMGIKLEIIENSINYGPINEAINKIDRLLSEKKNLYKLSYENQPIVNRKARNELDLYLLDIKRKNTDLVFADTEIKKASIEVKIKDLINNYNIIKDAHYKEGHLSIEEILEYNSKLEDLLNPVLEGDKTNERRV